MESSHWGKASCIFLGLAVGWCATVAIVLFIMHTGSFWTFNQSFMVLIMPVVGVLSGIGLFCGIVGSCMRDTSKTSSVLGASINAAALVVLILLAL